MSSAFQSYQNGREQSPKTTTKGMDVDSATLKDFELRLQLANMSRDEVIDCYLTDRQDLLLRIGEMEKLNRDMLGVLDRLNKEVLKTNKAMGDLSSALEGEEDKTHE